MIIGRFQNRQHQWPTLNWLAGFTVGSNPQFNHTVNLGKPAPRRRIFIAGHHDGNDNNTGRSFNRAEINGISTTKHIEANLFSLSYAWVASAIVPEGESVSVDVFFNGNLEGGGNDYSFYSCYNLASMDPFHSYVTNNGDDSGTVNVPDGGIVIAAAYGGDQWESGVNNDYPADGGGATGSLQQVRASSVFITGNNACGCALSWR
jgi:hypothetical protein